jgi:hypothetical protein
MAELAAAAAGGEAPPPLPPLPAAARARFWGHDEGELRGGGRGLLVARLLEEGEGEELRWLFAALGSEALAGWLLRHGGAALSRRSRAFWSVVLGVPAPVPRPLAAELWPLA